MPDGITPFLAHLIATAHANLAASATRLTGGGTATPRGAARAALQEAHSSLSQAAFFAALDALGGQEAALVLVEQALEGPPVQYYAQRNFVRFDASVHPGDQVSEDFEVVGPFPTEVEARQNALARGWHGAESHIHAELPKDDMIPCPICGLSVWPGDLIAHTEDHE